MLHLTVAGSLEPLADALAGELAEPLDDPFTPELVVVPGAGVRDWVTRRLAERVGVAANVDFAFPAALVGRVMADDDGFGAWAVGPLTWAIHEVLAAHGDELGQPADAVRARALADLFDRYALYRQPMVLRWSEGDDVGATGLPLAEHQRWQPALWRAVQAQLGGPTDAQRLAARAEGLRAGRLPPGALADLPERVLLFGLASLPPAHLDVLCALAHHRDVRVLAPVASPARWAWARRQLHEPLALPLPRTADGEAVRLAGPAAAGHPLITGWGRTSVEANLLLLDAAGQVADHTIVPPEIPGAPDDRATVLHRVQHRLRADLPLPRSDDGEGRPEADPADRSIRWLRTYGAARQVEVLRDALVHLFEERADDGAPRFEPRHVAVLCPDPARLAPLIHATFAGEEGEGVPALPVRVADRSLRQDNPLLDAAAALLELLDGRFRASSVLAFASRSPVRHRFGFDADALARMTEWVEATNVRWGLDATGHAGFGLPPELEGVHTWQAGLDQLLVGAAMAAGSHRLGPGDVVPFAEIEGDDVAVAGSLAELVHRLVAAVAALSTPASVTEWTGALGDALAALCAVPDTDAWQWRIVRRTLDDFAGEATLDGRPRTAQVAPADLAALLRARLTGDPGRPRFGTGAVTVSSLTAQRGVPYPVVCLLGLDDGAAGALAAAEDLVAAEPCVGDRDPRSELRAQLLDAVLAAGERLIICSNGHDLRTNAELPPPVALAELFDVIDGTVEGAARLITDHPRQAWAEQAFVPGALGVDGSWGFDRNARDAAMARRTQTPRQAFLPEPLPAPEPEEADQRGGVAVLRLQGLLDAATKPAEVLLRGRLGISLPGQDEPTEDQIRLRLEGLDRWKITRALLDATRRSMAGDDRLDVDAATWERVERRRGAVPPLAFGDSAVATAQERVRDLTRLLEVELSGVAHDPTTVPIDVGLTGLDGQALLVEGEVGGVCDGLLVAVTPSSLKDKDLLIAWIRLAALTCADPSRPWTSVTIGGGRNSHHLAVQRVSLRGPERAADVLALVADLHRRARCDAVPFFPATSRALASDGPAVARKTWYTRYGEAEDRWNGRLFPTDFDALLALPCRADERQGGGRDGGRVAWWAERIWGAVEETAIVEDDRAVDPPAGEAAVAT